MSADVQGAVSIRKTVLPGGEPTKIVANVITFEM